MAVESRLMWDSLVAETQFATELIITGLRRLCSVPTEPGLGGERRSNDRNYSLHVGMYSYSSGLERLCKLAIACNGYAAKGEFPKLKKYNHRIGGLLDAVEELVPSGPGMSMGRAKYLTRPEDDLDPELTNMVERFANGDGRYEYLDSLWKDNPEVSTFNEWSALAAKVSVPEEVRDLIALKDAMVYAIEAELADAGLESSSQRVREDLALPTYVPSVGVTLKLYRKVRWVAEILDVATYYTSQGIPILGEVVSPTLTQTTANFFRYDIARISDEEPVTEELEAVYKRIVKREAEDDEEEKWFP
ncbi:hypothetical protein [Arthrobacter sp. fls2-241-R2A-172]|uniref:hypothetical protein n=1 Tax=Arthrobacter sp. fls2-241-R2A-172 TaxID=3040325 RepID=UPI00254F33D1|nr:hypothetical protein [Arthrobacter sp. fls2-241-R2A-172]